VGCRVVEIKNQTLRHVVCATSDLIQDSSFNIEGWVLEKCAQAFRTAINNAIVIGDGIGKPMGLLKSQSGIAICDTAVATPPGMFTWQDLVMLKFEVPMQWHAGGAYLMNQRTFALLLTMSDANGRLLLSQLPQAQAGFVLAGSPITIASQMPDAAEVRYRSAPVLGGEGAERD
jgi:HK97 family phage major capsid protein